MTTAMVEVTQEDANNYCRVLAALGMEEEGDPVAAIEKLQTSADLLKAFPGCGNLHGMTEWVASVRAALGLIPIVNAPRPITEFLKGDCGVREGTNRTTSGTIGQP